MFSEVRPRRRALGALEVHPTWPQTNFTFNTFCPSSAHSIRACSRALTTMSTHMPLRSVRASALQRQCIFIRSQHLNRPFAHSASRAFSATPSRPKKPSILRDRAQTRAAIKSQVRPAPRVNRAEEERTTDSLQEDIGLLQHTIVRAPFSQLPSPLSREFWAYFWAFIKAKGTGVYS